MKHTIPIFTRKKDKFELYGTGVLIEVKRAPFLVTASHVVEEITKDKNSHLYIRLEENLWSSIGGDIKYTDLELSNGVDLAYVKVPDGLNKNYQNSIFFSLEEG